MALVMTAPRDELHSATDWSAAAWAQAEALEGKLI